MASKDKNSKNGKSGSWFGWSSNQGGKGAGVGLSAGASSKGGNFWVRSDGSSGRSSTQRNTDGTLTTHIVERSAGERRGRATDTTFTADGRDVGSPRRYRTRS